VRFYRDDFVKYAAFMEKNYRLRISGTWKQRYNSQDEYEFKVTGIDYMSELMEKESKYLEMALMAQWVDDEMVDQLQKLAKKYKGNKPFIINILTSKDKVPIQLRSKTLKVQPNRYLLDEIKQLQTLSFSIRPDDSRYRKLTSRKEVLIDEAEEMAVDDF
jgi:DNA polymerase-3 subunit alpha